MKAFLELIPEFEKYHTQVLGVNKDSIDSHIKVKEKFGLTYPLLSDPESILAKQLDIAKLSLFDNLLKLSGRHTFLIQDGKVIKEYKNVKSPGKHPQEVLDFIKTL